MGQKRVVLAVPMDMTAPVILKGLQELVTLWAALQSTTIQTEMADRLHIPVQVWYIYVISLVLPETGR